MMKKHLLTALTLVSISSFAWAGSGSIMFQNLDANLDGQITREEVKNAPDVSNNFNQVDANKDGKLDAAEFSALETRPTALEAQPTENMPHDATPMTPKNDTLPPQVK